MKTLSVGSRLPKDVYHLVLMIDEPILIHFQHMIDDILISSPEGDILLSWDVDHDSEWSDEKCMLLREGDKLKEIGGIKTSLLALKSATGTPLKVYLTAQTN